MKPSSPEKILYVDALNDSQAQANIRGIRKAYEKIGEVICFDYRTADRLVGMIEANEKLNRLAIDNKVDFIHLGKGESILGASIKRLKAALPGVKIIHFYGDYRPTPPPWVIDLGRNVDVTLIQGKDEGLRGNYHQAGCHRVEFLNCGTDPEIFFPQQIDKEYDVVFMANYSKPDKFEWMQGRLNLVKTIAANEFNVHIFGTGWGKLGQTRNITLHPFVAGEAFATECSKAKLALAYGTNKVRGYTSWPRLLNSMASETMVLTRYFPGLEDIFENTYDLQWFVGEDVIGLIDYYLSNDEEREKIAQAGRTQVLKSHTWDKRIEKILSYV